jgi:hypothetical protein
MASTVLENITSEQLALLVRGIVDERIGEIIGDPDFGLEIRDEIRKRLLKQKAEVEAGEFGRRFDDVLEELGLIQDVPTKN